MNAFIPVLKPRDISSFAVVKGVRKIIGKEKIGHCGTLDPFADGVLIIAIGRYTKLAELVMESPKEYLALIELGKTTDTLDTEGTIVREETVPEEINLDELKEKFLGKQMQKIPAFSAAKIDGKKFYELARKGEEVPDRSKEIEIYNIDFERKSHTLLEMKVLCSKGTYVRQLAEDIAAYLGTCGYLIELKRTQVGKVRLEDTLDFNKIDSMELKDYFYSAGDFFADYPVITIGSAVAKKYFNGFSLYELLANNDDEILEKLKENQIYIVKSSRKILSFVRCIRENDSLKLKNIVLLDEMKANETDKVQK